MANSETERVNTHRRKIFDQINLLVKKGVKDLYRVIALRENIPMTEMIRRSVLARAGLNMVPFTADLKKLEDVTTPEAAMVAIEYLQTAEQLATLKKLIPKNVIEPAENEYAVIIKKNDEEEFLAIIQKIMAALRDTPQSAVNKLGGTPVILKGREVGVLRRFLSNIRPADGLYDK